MTHTLEEGPEEIQAVEKSGRIVQTGTQQRSWPHYVQGKQIVASGALGVVRLVEAFWFMNYGVRGVKSSSESSGALRPISTGRPGWDRRPPSLSMS